MLAGLIRFSITQKLIVALLIFALFAGGLWAYMRLPVEAFPDVLNEFVQVITLAPGQSAEDVEKKITAPLEREFAGIPKLIQKRSISEFGLSVVYLYFDDNVDKYWARTQVLEKIGTADLPAGAQPTLAPMAAVTGEIMRYQLKGSGYSETKLRSIQDWIVEKEFKVLPGVADVTGYGGKVLTWEVGADPLKLATYGISIRQLGDAVANANSNGGGNFIHWPTQSFVVRSDGEIHKISDIENTSIAQKNASIIRVKDVAHVTESFAPQRGVVGRDEHDQIVQGILLLRKGENPILVGQAIRNKIKELNLGTILPEGVHISTYYDRLDLVDKTTKTVGHNLLEGLILVALVLYFFLRNLRATLLVTFLVPLSLFFAFLCMVLSGTPANLISLGAIDFGIIVDGGLLIVEHVLLRSQQTHQKDSVLVEEATTEIAKPVAFSMFMTILAYLPIFTLQRVEGKMFSPLAWTISFALLGALACSLLIIPAFLTNVLKHSDNEHHEPDWYLKTVAFYEKCLAWGLENQKKFFYCCGGVAALGVALFAISGSEFLPELDEGALWIRASFPHSTSVEEGIHMAHEIRAELKKFPEVHTVVSQLGGPEDGTDPNLTDNCEFFVDLFPKDKWQRFHGSRLELIEMVRRNLRQFAGVDFNISQPIADNVEEAIAGVKGKNAVKIFGPDLQVLNEIAHNLIAAIKTVPGTIDVSPTAVMPVVPQLTIQVDRVKVGQAGLSLQDVNDLVEIAVGGKNVTHVYDNEMRIDVAVRAASQYRDSVQAIQNLPIPLANGSKVQLGTVAKVSLLPSPQVITRENGYRRMGVKFAVEGRDLGSAMKEILAHAATVKIPAGYFLEWGGEYENQKRAMARLQMVLPATILLLAVVLFMLFNNLTAVLAVVSTMLISIVGSVLLLYIRGIPFSVSAAVGLLALFGVVSLNGVALTSAIMKADPGEFLATCREKFRPILMTSILAGLGLLPAAISHGIGSETQKPLATAVIGGILTGLPAVLLYLPIVLRRFLAKDKIC